MKILFVGDVVGKGGRQAVCQHVPELMSEYGCDFCVVNGENMAGGNGMTRNCLKEFADVPIDVFTSGDHTWDQKEFAGEINDLPNVLRPANFCTSQPGRGYGVFVSRSGLKIGVLNLVGRVFVGVSSNCPFEMAEKAVEELRKETEVILVDFHAEATSEKIAMGRFLDGKVSAVVGTHTHVQTADEQIFPGGTAFICDVGMVGSEDSILGRDINAVVEKFRTGMPARFAVNETNVRLHGVVVTIDEKSGRATQICRIRR